MSLAVAEMRAAFPAFAEAGGAGLHYLDNAAMTQMAAAAMAAVEHHSRSARANVRRGLYALAERADAAYDAARARVAAFLGAADPAEVVFTANATAALNLAAQALGAELGPGDEVVVSRLEHHSNLLPWLLLGRTRGVTVRTLPLTPEGGIDTGALAATIGPRCRVIALSHASNVTGAVLDPAPVVAAARRVGARVVLDGAQAAAHLPLDVRGLGVDFYAFSGHKVFGPTGIGVLWGRQSVLAGLPPPWAGGGMVEEVAGESLVFAPPPQRFEAGTPPVEQAVGLAAALDWLTAQDRLALTAHQRRLTAQLLDGLAARPGVRLVGPPTAAGRVPVVSFGLDGLHPHDVCQVLAECGVAVRGGSHCAQPLLAALELDGVVRASFAPYNDEDDVAALLDGLDAARRLLA